MKNVEPTEHEIKVLEMMNGDREWASGAWVNACCGFLKGNGYATGMPYQITQKGKDFLANRSSNQ